MKYNGGVAKADLAEENLDALAKGIVNLEKHIENIQKYKVPVIVTLNSFVTDTDAENEFICRFCEERGCEFALSEVWEKGGEGGIALAEKVLDTLENKKSDFELLYEDSLSLEEKIEKIAKEIYGADGVVYEPAAKKQMQRSNHWDSEVFRYVWQRISTLCLMMQKNSEDRTALTSTSAKYM